MRTIYTITVMLVISISSLFSQVNVVSMLQKGNNVYTVSQCGICKYSMNGTKLTLLGCDSSNTFTKGRMAISSDGNYLYIADDSLMVYNLSANNPSLTKTITVEGLATDAKITGNYLVIASPLLAGKDVNGDDTQGGINIFNISTPSNPTLISQGKSTLDDYCDRIEKIDILNNYVYGFTGDYGCGNPRLYIWNINNINNPQEAGFELGNISQYVVEIKVINDNWALVLTKDGDLNLFNIQNKSNPTWVNKISRTRTIPPKALSIIGNTAYAIHNDGIDIFDISDPANGSHRDSDKKYYSNGINFTSMIYTGSYFIVTSPSYLYFFDTNLNKLDSTQLTICSYPSSIGDNIDLQSMNFKIYPNPVNDNFKINYNTNLIVKGKINIFNAFGQTVYSTDVNSEENEITINTQSFPSGVYWVQLYGGSGLVQNEQIIIIK